MGSVRKTYLQTLLNQWQVHIPAANILPVQTDRCEPKSLVTVRATEEISDNILRAGWGILRRKTDDVKAVEDRCDVRRNDLIAEHRCE